MGKFDKLKKQNQQISADIKREAGHFQEVASEYKRVAQIYQAPAVILNKLERDFERATKLSGVDVGFLLFATALQCVRQYFLTQFKLVEERPTDEKAASDAWWHRETHSNRGNHYYNPTFQEILANPVPFDAMQQDDCLKGVFRGTGHFGHRTTLGHDPILGWVVGTANIATSTLTTWDLKSYHVKTGLSKCDKLVEMADTTAVFSHTVNKLFLKEGQFCEHPLEDSILKKSKVNQLAGPVIIALSLILEWEHLNSDIDSKKSLPFPMTSAVSPDLSGKLARYGIDMCNINAIGKQASYSMLINFLVSMIHRKIYDETCGLSLSMYEVKTRKILTYSNVIASASNVIAVAVMEAIAAATENAELAKRGMKYFDIGGLMVTLYRIITDHKFIKEVKQEFMEKQWYDIVLGEDYEFMKEVK